MIYPEAHALVDAQDLLLSTTMETHTNYETHALRQEREHRSDYEPNMTAPPPTPEEQDIYMGSFWDNIHDYGFMKTYAVID